MKRFEEGELEIPLTHMYFEDRDTAAQLAETVESLSEEISQVDVLGASQQSIKDQAFEDFARDGEFTLAVNDVNYRVDVQNLDSADSLASLVTLSPTAKNIIAKTIKSLESYSNLGAQEIEKILDYNVIQHSENNNLEM